MLGWGMGFPAGVRRDFTALERRRMQAGRVVEQGVPQAEVARQGGAHRQSVSQWAAEWREKGRAGLKKAGRGGRKPGRSEADRKEVVQGLRGRSEAAGYSTSLWP